MNLSKAVRRVQTYFVAGVILKVTSAIASLLLNQALWLGFILPIGVMLCYWFVGYRVREKWDVQLTLAKFADSIYYLGFLFTVGSIIICLLDINAIGDNLNGMATRFGAAMVSTAIGMLARVLHTGFKVDTNDAVKSVEERAIQSAEYLTMSFDAASQQLEVFRDQVMAASKEAVQSVHEQIGAISEHSTNAMEAYFVNATKQSNEAFERILKDANDASSDLLDTINGLSHKSEQTLSRMESHALDFGKRAQDRLEQTLFPDDLFAQKLKPAIDTLSSTTEGVSDGISILAEDVKTAARQVGTAIRGLNTKTQLLEGAVTTVGSIVDSQERLMETIKSQNQEVLDRVERTQKEYLDSLDDHREDFMADVKANQQVIGKIVDKLAALQTAVNSDITADRISHEVADAMAAISEAGVKGNEALGNTLRSTLMPLVEAIQVSNGTHRSLAVRVEQSNRTIETAHAQLDELMGKIDHINKVEIDQPAVNEASIAPSVSAIAAPIAPPAGSVFDSAPEDSAGLRTA